MKAVSNILDRLLLFHDSDVDGDTCKPNIVWAISIVLGHRMASMIQQLRERDAPSAKETVFSLAADTFGVEGPVTCHPFARKYDIVYAVYDRDVPHPTASPSLGRKQSVFVVHDPADESVITKGTLHDSRRLPSNMTSGDVVRLEVISSSPTHMQVRYAHEHAQTHITYAFTQLQVPTDVSFAKSRIHNRPTIILAVEVFGFLHVNTEKFIVRPSAPEFLLQVSRHYNIATVSRVRGSTNKTGLFGMYPLLFTCEEGNLPRYLADHQLDSSNAFILDVCASDNTDYNNVSITKIYTSRYIKKNIRDVELGVSSTICKFITSIVDRSNLGIHINEFNSNK